MKIRGIRTARCVIVFKITPQSWDYGPYLHWTSPFIRNVNRPSRGNHQFFFHYVTQFPFSFYSACFPVIHIFIIFARYYSINVSTNSRYYFNFLLIKLLFASVLLEIKGEKISWQRIMFFFILHLPLKKSIMKCINRINNIPIPIYSKVIHNHSMFEK